MYVDIVISNAFNLNKHFFFLFFFLESELARARIFLILLTIFDIELIINTVSNVNDIELKNTTVWIV